MRSSWSGGGTRTGSSLSSRTDSVGSVVAVSLATTWPRPMVDDK